jgi:hypothetical protein
VRTVTRSIEDFCVTSSESFGKLINSKKFWGKRGNNSIEFDTYSDNCRILLEKMKNAEETKNPVSIAECRELLKNIEESAMTYVRAKRVQKGYDTREIPDFDVDKRMLGNSDKGGPMIMTTKGRERYDFAITTLLATGQMKLSLDSLEKKLEDDAKEIKRVEKYENNRKTFLEHKEKLNKQFEAFAKSRNKLKGNAEIMKIRKITSLILMSAVLLMGFVYSSNATVTSANFTAEELDSSEYNIRKYTTPFWEGNIVYNEVVYPIVDEKIDTYYFDLMYEATEIISVKDYRMEKEYTRGTDYHLVNGDIYITSVSDIKRVSHEFIHP